MLVNNLKVSANTRAVVGDIVVTPYDLRYPVWAIWLVQMAEDTINLVLASVAIGAMVAAAVAVLYGAAGDVVFVESATLFRYVFDFRK